MSVSEIVGVVGLAVTMLGLAVFVGKMLERQRETEKNVEQLQTLFNLDSKDGPTFVHASQFKTHLQIDKEHRGQFREMLDELKGSLKSLEDKFDNLATALLRSISNRASSEKNE